MYSVHIMSHNNHELLNRCLDHLRRFTPAEYLQDIVITDDASEPEYDIKDATIVRMPRRSNCCNLRNVGMEMCRGEFVFWVDNDCLVDEGWYKPLVNGMTDGVGLVGDKTESRMIRNPFFPITQEECMIEYQFAYDYNHLTGECDFIQSPCCLVRKEAYRPIYCYGMPTPTVDPELGAWVKYQGYKVVVADGVKYNHLGSQTPRVGGREYQHHLAENFAKWFKFWEPHKEKVFELYSGKKVEYQFDGQSPSRPASRGMQGDFCKGEPIYG